jgi:hypothetical protein
VVLDQDELRFGSEHFVVHVHGATDEVHPPQPLRVSRLAAAAALALSVGCGDGESSTSTVPPPPKQTSQQGGAPVGSEAKGGASSNSTLILGGGGEVAVPLFGIGGRGIDIGRAGAAGEIEVVETPPL